MRWKLPQPGDLKIRWTLCLIPRCLNGEYRWLELTRIVRRYEARDNDGRAPWEWRTVGWVEYAMERRLDGEL